MKINQELRTALDLAYNDVGSIRKLALKANIRYATLYQIIKKQTEFINKSNYEKLLPVLQSYLKASIEQSEKETELDKVIINNLKKLSEVQKAKIIEDIYSLLETSSKAK